MSYAIITIVLLAIVALASSSLSIFDPHDEHSVFIRFYPTFAQLYRPAMKSNASEFHQKKSSEHYRFVFPVGEYVQISEESLTILFANVTERTITYHSMPNFEEVGSRYFYRRHPKDSEGVEIELVNAEDRLFREVRQPTRYFYLTTFDSLEYSKRMPIRPYYEVTFICNSSSSKNTQSPFLTYIDKNLQWKPRYILDLPTIATNKQPEIHAYADIVNNGDQPMAIQGLEFVAGDIQLNERTFDSSPVQPVYQAYTSGYQSAYRADTSSVRSLGKQESGTYVYQVSLPPSFTLTPRSTKSIEFFATDVTIDSFHQYAAEFSPVNANGKLLNAYNITSQNTFIPNGRLLLRQEGDFIGQTTLPDLAIGETHTMAFGYDADVSYRRQVRILKGDEDSESMTYHVEYTFENYTPTRNVRVYFIESFNSLKHFQIKNISQSKTDRNEQDLVSYGTELRGFMIVPRSNGRKTISYDLTTYRTKPESNIDH